MSRDLQDSDYYITHGGQIPVRWTAPEVCFDVHVPYSIVCAYNRDHMLITCIVVHGSGLLRSRTHTSQSTFAYKNKLNLCMHVL